MTDAMPRDRAAAAPPPGAPVRAQTANLALRFLLELAALGALAYWGLHTGDSWLGDLALGLGTPLLAAAVWGVWAAPNSTTRLHGAGLLAVQLAVLGGGAVALVAAGQAVAGVAMAALVGVNAILLHPASGTVAPSRR